MPACPARAIAGAERRAPLPLCDPGACRGTDAVQPLPAQHLFRRLDPQICDPAVQSLPLRRACLRDHAGGGDGAGKLGVDDPYRAGVERSDRPLWWRLVGAPYDLQGADQPTAKAPQRSAKPERATRHITARSLTRGAHTTQFALRLSKNAPIPSAASLVSQRAASASIDIATASWLAMPPRFCASFLAAATAPGAQAR